MTDKTDDDKELEELLNEIEGESMKREELQQLHVNRLTRKGHKYFNLSPFEVLQVDPDAPPDEFKRAFRRLSILVHPDKCPLENAQAAFDALKQAQETLNDPAKLKECKEVVNQARQEVADEEKEKKKKAAKDKVAYVEPSDVVKKEMVLKKTLALLAQMENARLKSEERRHNEKKRLAEQMEEQRQVQKETQEIEKQWEKTREKRVDNWRDFMSKNKSKVPLASGSSSAAASATRSSATSAAVENKKM